MRARSFTLRERDDTADGGPAPGSAFAGMNGWRFDWPPGCGHAGAELARPAVVHFPESSPPQGVEMRTGLAPAMLGLSIAFAAVPAAAQAPLPPIRDMDTLVVSGVQPGPGMWKITRDDHTLYVLGTLSPLPRRMEWESRDVENVIAQAQEVIQAPSVSIDGKLGIFQRLLLAPKALSARKNPDGQTLQQVVPADMYARWLVLKRKYMGRDEGVEQWRPMMAALELYDEAMDDNDLKQYGMVSPVVEKMARRHKVPLTTTRVTIVIEDPKVELQEFRESKLDDVDCFGKTMQRLESDLAMMRERANAWAIGDIATLKAL